MTTTTTPGGLRWGYDVGGGGLSVSVVDLSVSDSEPTGATGRSFATESSSDGRRNFYNF
ncbi:hypothetical protein M569_17311 [Genlisea aurea]|uniref:Uncharacterized protein n=1 Tax=Genlisea aurea TaxID=192259 RepID=S8BZB5_9LAMI|nr:hypothetical protein M569_17311 [Genlisea aurea]